MKYIRGDAARSEVFLREDLGAILEAIDSSNRMMALAVHSQEANIFRAGFSSALQAIAKACHIDLEVSERPEFSMVDQSPMTRIESAAREWN